MYCDIKLILTTDHFLKNIKINFKTRLVVKKIIRQIKTKEKWFEVIEIIWRNWKSIFGLIVKSNQVQNLN